LSIYLLGESFYQGVVNLPQIEVTCRDIELDLSPYNALVFSSKNGVKAINSINKKWRKIPSYAIGESTANEIRKLGGVVEFTASSSYGDSFAKELVERLIGRNCLFLRAKTVVTNLEQILKNSGVNIESKVVYETTCKEQTSLHVNQERVIFIFTSPSTVECFFKNHKWCDEFRAVCIGEVTAKALPDGIVSSISKTQTIQSCIELAKTIIKQN
jgi:uroporphyrinogen-III synthase